MYSWTGDKALRELEEANISKQCFPILLECATKVSHLYEIYIYIIIMLWVTLIIYQLDRLFKAIKVATDLETDKPHLSGMSVITLEGLGLCHLKYVCFCIQLLTKEYLVLSMMFFINLISGLFSSLTYFFSRNGSHMLDYQLALQRCVRKDVGK